MSPPTQYLFFTVGITVCLMLGYAIGKMPAYSNVRHLQTLEKKIQNNTTLINGIAIDTSTIKRMVVDPFNN